MKKFVETGMKIMGKKAANNPGAIKAAGKSLKDKTSPMKKERLLEGVKARLKLVSDELDKIAGGIEADFERKIEYLHSIGESTLVNNPTSMLGYFLPVM